MVATNALTLFVLLGPPGSAASMAADQTRGPVIDIEDVARFYKVYDAAHGHPSAEELQRDYIDPGSPGLHHLAEVRRVTGVTIAKGLAAHPQIFLEMKDPKAFLARSRWYPGVRLK